MKNVVEITEIARFRLNMINEKRYHDQISVTFLVNVNEPGVNYSEMIVTFSTLCC